MCTSSTPPQDSRWEIPQIVPVLLGNEKLEAIVREDPYRRVSKGLSPSEQIFSLIQNIKERTPPPKLS